MSSISVTTHEANVGQARRLARLAAVGLALLGTSTVWLIATAGFGVDLRAPVFETGAQNPQVGPGMVAFATLVGGLAGWAFLVVAERLFGARGRRIWAAFAIVALALSLGGPLSGTGAAHESRIVLALMHLVAGGVLIPVLYRTSRSDR